MSEVSLETGQWDRLMEVLWTIANNQATLLKQSREGMMTAAQAKAIREAHDKLEAYEIEAAPSECISPMQMSDDEKARKMREHNMFSRELEDLEEQFPYLFD